MEQNSLFIPVTVLCETGPESVRLQEHAGLLLFVCREGQAEYRLHDRCIPLRAKDILLIPPGVERGVLSPAGAEYSHVMIAVAEDTVTTFEELEGRALPPELFHRGYYHLRTAATRWEHLAALGESIFTEAERRQPGWNSVLYASTFVLMALLGRASLEKSTQLYNQNDLLEQILQYVERNIGQKITLADTAHRFLVSESYISKLFRSRLDTSFYHYVIQRRLTAARQLIAAGNPLEHVYAQVGFCDHAAFYRAFRQAYGISPKQYKTALSTGLQDEL